MECYTHLRKIQDLLSDGKTPYERRFGEPLKGPIIPFGSLVKYYPISAKDLLRLHQLGPKVLPGIFIGCALNAGESGKEDIVVADIEVLEQMDASELHARRLNAKEVLTHMKGETFTFPVADGTVKISGGDRYLRTSIHLNPGSFGTRRETRNSPRRIRRTLFSIPTTSGLNTR